MEAQDKVAFITGANKGLGFETARELGELGIAVVIGSRDEAKGSFSLGQGARQPELYRIHAEPRGA